MPLDLSRRMRATAIRLILLLSSGCGVVPLRLDLAGGSPEQTTRDGLYRVGADHLDAVFVRPRARLSGYDSVLIDPPTVAYSPPPRLSPISSGRQRAVPLGPQSTARMKQLFDQALRGSISTRGDLAFAAEPGPRVLRLSGHIVDVVVDSPPSTPTEVDILGGSGAMTMLLLVQDSVSGASLALFADRREIEPDGPLSSAYASSPVNLWGGVRSVFGIWASLLCDGIEQLRALPEIPPPPSPPVAASGSPHWTTSAARETFWIPASRAASIT